ncbi:hypothetical protein [Rhizobium leguminosarum]|uniref:hypothetical protein n=1 Tax=Rhizobium leguminosarum TaxID=384 RepID=UPI001C964AEA|nr:hypothetical protein [Rhizobium leguminosarum]MBY5646342.1 hypothetical protein [Rhizobium leguminosarum]
MVGLAMVAALKGLEMDWQNLIEPPQGTWRPVIESPPLAPADYAEEQKNHHSSQRT